MDDDVSKLDYMEVQYQLQATELIAQKGPLSEGNLTLLDALEARENEIIQAKLAQTFDTAPGTADNLDNREAWNKAGKDKGCGPAAEALARRHLKDEAALADKRKEDIRKFGPSADLDAVHASQQRYAGTAIRRRTWPLRARIPPRARDGPGTRRARQTKKP